MDSDHGGRSLAVRDEAPAGASVSFARDEAIDSDPAWLLGTLREHDPHLAAWCGFHLRNGQSGETGVLLEWPGFITWLRADGLGRSRLAEFFEELGRAVSPWLLLSDGRIVALEHLHLLVADDETKAKAPDSAWMVGHLVVAAPGSGPPGGLDPARLLALLAGVPQIRVQMAPALRLQLDHSAREIEATPEQLPYRAPRFDGSGVIVGVVDYGCDFAHPNFRTIDGRSRLLYLWDQNDGTLGPLAQQLGTGHAPKDFVDYGREFDRAALDAALGYGEEAGGPEASRPDFVDAADRPYWALGYDPHDNYYELEVRDGAHGTHVLDVAAGNGRASRTPNAGAPGIAPAADIIFVQVKRPRESDGRRRIDGARVLEAIGYIFRRAQQLDRPAVVNLSLNTNAGPHDGSSSFDRALDALLTVRPWLRAITIASANFGTENLHTSGSVDAGAGRTLTWRFDAGDPSRNDLEVWYDGADGALTATLVSPDGKSRWTAKPGEERTVTLDDTEIGSIVNNLRNPYANRGAVATEMQAAEPAAAAAASARDGPDCPDHERPDRATMFILVSLHPARVTSRRKRQDAGDAPPHEDWTLDLALDGEPAAGTKVRFNAWIDHDDEGQSRFPDDEMVAAQSLGTFSCGRRPIVVGAYYGVPEDRPALHGGSLGPTRIGRRKPDISAPGREVLAALSKGFRPLAPGSKWRTAARVSKHGTSVAAPHVAGVVALLFQRAAMETRPVSSDLVRQALIESARRGPQDPPPQGPDCWHPAYGFGRVSAARALRRLEELLAEQAAAAAPQSPHRVRKKTTRGSAGGTV